MFRLFVLVCLIAPFAHAELPALQSEVSAAEPVAPAELKKNEILLSSSSAGFSGSSDKFSESQGANFDVGYNRSLTKLLQIGGYASYTYNANQYGGRTSTSKSFDMRVGPTFNFGTAHGVENAFYLGLFAGAGTTTYNYDNYDAYDTNSIHYMAKLGKRFQIFENVSLSPYAYVMTYNSGNTTFNDSYTTYGIQLLSASVLW